MRKLISTIGVSQVMEDQTKYFEISKQLSLLSLHILKIFCSYKEIHTVLPFLFLSFCLRPSLSMSILYVMQRMTPSLFLRRVTHRSLFKSEFLWSRKTSQDLVLEIPCYSKCFWVISTLNSFQCIFLSLFFLMFWTLFFCFILPLLAFSGVSLLDLTQ